MVRVAAAAAPAPPRADLERIWSYAPGLHRSETEREFGMRMRARIWIHARAGGEWPVAALGEILA